MPTQEQMSAAIKAGYTPQQIKLAIAKAGSGQPKGKSVGGFMGNIVGSGFKAVGDLGGALINTVNPDMEKNTVANLGKLVIGTLQYIDPTQALGTKYEKNAKAVGQFYLDRYGSVDKVMNTLYNDPVGMALDVGAVLSGAGGALKGAGSVSKVAGLTKAGNAFSKAASFTDPLSLIGKGVGKVTSGTRAKLISGLDKAGENIVTRGIGNPAAQAKAAQKAGRSVSSFIDEYNLYDRSPESAAKVSKSIIDKYDELALRSGSNVPMGQVIQAFENEILRLRKGVNGVISESDNAKIAELMKRRDMLIEASGATYHNPLKPQKRLTVGSDGVLQQVEQPMDPALRERFVSSMPINVGTDTLTNFRRNVIDPDVPKSQFALDAKGSGAAQGVKQARDIVKAGIDSTDPRLSKLGKDYGMAKSMEKILTQADARGQNRQMFNFTKLGGAGVGGIISGAPGVATGFALETMVNHPRLIAGASKTMKAGSQALQSPRIPNLTNKMGRITSPTYNYAKAGRVTNVSLDQKTPISTSTGKVPQKQSSPQQLSASQPSYTPMPKLPPIQVPKKSAQAFGGRVKLQRGSFY